MNLIYTLEQINLKDVYILQTTAEYIFFIAAIEHSPR